MNKIAKKLFLYFLISLLTVSLIISFVFLSIFRTHTFELQKTQLESRAVTVADSISQYLTSNTGSMGHYGSSGFGGFMRALNSITASDIWVVDSDMNLIKYGMASNDITYYEIPDEGMPLIEAAFTGETAFSESFSNLLEEQSLSVATPVFNDNNDIIAVVLMNTAIKGIESAINEAINMLIISLLIAVALSLVISIFLSLRFVRPIKKINDTTKKLVDNDYSAKTNIEQNDEIGELAKTVDILSERLMISDSERQKLEKMRNDFITNISHELRTPVTVIRGSLETICDGVITDKAAIDDFHKQMLNESIHLQRLVNDLLDLSKLQNVDFHIEKTDLNLYDVVSDSVYGMKNVAKNKNININFESYSKAIPVLGDYSRLKQMISIIIDNAIKFSKENSEVIVTAKTIADKIEISIHDSGIGMSTEEKENIFERFYKNNSEQNKNGTGLGLAIAKQIADRHQAKIVVESEIGRGSTFKIILPK